MPKAFPREEPDKRSRFNRIIQYGLTLSTAVAPTLLQLPHDPMAQSVLGVVAGGAVLVAYDRIYAQAFVNWNHQPQALYEIPWRDGVLVVQPRHHLALNPYRPWRGRLRNESIDDLYTVHGHFATKELADQYCQNAKVGVGTFVHPERAVGLQRTIAKAQAYAKETFKNIRPTDVVPQSSWRTIALPDDSGRYGAYRYVLTNRGPRIEFSPAPPAGAEDTAALKERLKPQRDAHLDARVLDDGLEPASPVTPA